nr:hypothetical protein CFP56_39641 [Quercus suber]
MQQLQALLLFSSCNSFVLRLRFLISWASFNSNFDYCFLPILKTFLQLGSFIISSSFFFFFLFCWSFTIICCLIEIKVKLGYN